MARRKNEMLEAEASALPPGFEYVAIALFTLGGGVRVRFDETGTARRAHRLTDDGDGWWSTREALHVKAGETLTLEEPIPRHLFASVTLVSEPPEPEQEDGQGAGDAAGEDDLQSDAGL